MRLLSPAERLRPSSGVSSMNDIIIPQSGFLADSFLDEAERFVDSDVLTPRSARLMMAAEGICEMPMSPQHASDEVRKRNMEPFSPDRRNVEPFSPDRRFLHTSQGFVGSPSSEVYIPTSQAYGGSMEARRPAQLDPTSQAYGRSMEARRPAQLDAHLIRSTLA